VHSSLGAAAAKYLRELDPLYKKAHQGALTGNAKTGSPYKGIFLVQYIKDEGYDSHNMKSESPSEEEQLFAQPYNLEDGRWFNKSNQKFYINSSKIRVELLDIQGNVIKTYESIRECAKDLGFSRTFVNNRLTNNKPILINNESVYIKKVIEIPKL
jgi:hypothetical protein